MNLSDLYKGTFLNHLEGVYRAEDRALAIELTEALGLAVKEVRFTENSRPILAGNFNPAVPDPTNNIVFLYEMHPLQRRVIDALDKTMASNGELQQAVSAYREAAAKMPPIMPHFGIRYESETGLTEILGKLASGLSPALASRVSVWEVPAYQPIEGLPDIHQVFVMTDVMTLGTAGFDQAIELQALRGQ